MMKIKTLLTQSLLAAMLGFSANASAGFDFGSPFDWMDNDDDDYYRYGARDGRGYGGNYGRERWRQYDEWEPNYWRYRYFDDDSRDYVFDGFDGDGFGDGRGRFDFNMDMDMDSDSRFDGYNDYRNRGRRGGGGFPGFDNFDDYSNFDDFSNFDSFPGFDRGNRDSDRGYQSRDRGYDSYDRPARRAPESNSRDQYNDDYWRDYSRRYNGNERRR